MADESDLRDKVQILARMAESRRALQSALERLTPEAMARPGVWGAYSVKDLLAHITYWQVLCTERLQKFGTGRADEIVYIGEGEVDQVNDNVYRANKDRSLPDMLEACADSYQALRTAVKQLPPTVYQEDQQPRAVREMVAGNSYLHYEEHLADIEKAAT